MELFAAATGCDDMGIASLYLERAGNDVTRAVNHYLDSPPPAEGSAKTAATLHAVMSSTKAKPKQHHMRGGTGVKRPRDAGGSGQQGLLTFQPPIPRTLSLQGNVGSCSLSRDGEDSGESELRDDVDVSKLKFCGSSTSGPTLRAATPSTMDNKGRSGTSPFSPSAKWVEIAELCQRRGVQFDDERFPPRPTSLDGRPGRVSTPPSKNPNLGEEEDKQALRCRCDMPAKVVTVSKAGPNQGKLFYGCVTRKCNFFRWADDAPHTRQALSLVWRRFTPPRFKLTTTLLGRSEGSAFKPQDIKQGAVGDCWFLAGLAVVSERSDLIARVVGCTPSLCDEVGCFEVNLFKDGCWERVLVDSWLPCKDPAMLKGKEKGLDHLPAFAKTSNNQTWPCIVEKVAAKSSFVPPRGPRTWNGGAAFAKQHGSFEAISGGHVCEAFEALTGAPTETVELDDNDSEGNWAKLLSFSQAEFPMGCATAWDPTRDLRNVGLVSTHAYSVLEVRELPLGVLGARQPTMKDWAGLGSATAAAAKARQRDGGGPGQPLRLLRVRNPWGKTEWNGEWSDKSDRWSDSVREVLGWSKKNDGTFWMTWQDFMTRFQLVDVCKARRGWTHTSIASGSLPKPDFCRSFSIQPPSHGGSTWAYLTVMQPTKRGRKDSYWYRAFGLILTEVGRDGLRRGGDTLIASSLGGVKRSISCEVFLESGKEYTASVVYLGGSTSTSALGSFQGRGSNFCFTVYSARHLQVAAMEKGLRSPSAVPVGPALHQAVSHRWLEIGPLVDSPAVSGDVIASHALGSDAALSVVPVGGSAALFVLINTMSATTVGVRLSITSIEGASAMGATRTHHAGEVLQWECPPSSQMLTLILTRTGDHGVFRHAYFYRLTSPAATPPSTSREDSDYRPNAPVAAPGRNGSSGAQAQQLPPSRSVRPSSPPEVLDLSSTPQNAGNSKTKVEPVQRETSTVSGHCHRNDDSNAPVSASSITAAAGLPCDDMVYLKSSQAKNHAETQENCSLEGAKGGGIHIGRGMGVDGARAVDLNNVALGARGGSVAGGAFSAQPLLPGAEAIVRRAYDEEPKSSVGGIVEGYGGGTVGAGGRGIGSCSRGI